MKEFLSPKSVAIIGASSDETKLGGMLTKNMISAGFDRSKIYPVNPKGGEIMGLKAYPNVKDVGAPIDLAVVSVKAEFVIQAIEDCGAAGIHHACILTAGFKETGDEGARLEKKLVETARKHKVRITGPNCFGAMNLASGVNYTFSREIPPIGNISIMSQSGAVGSSILDWACANGVGLSNFVTFGNKCDLDEAHFIRYFSEDPHTKVIGMYIEGISDGQALMDAIENMKVRKPIVVFKSGRTEAGS